MACQHDQHCCWYCNRPWNIIIIYLKVCPICLILYLFTVYGQKKKNLFLIQGYVHANPWTVKKLSCSEYTSVVGRASKTPELHNQVSEGLWHIVDKTQWCKTLRPLCQLMLQFTQTHTYLCSKKWLLGSSVYICVCQPENLSYVAEILISNRYLSALQNVLPCRCHLFDCVNVQKVCECKCKKLCYHTHNATAWLRKSQKVSVPIKFKQETKKKPKQNQKKKFFTLTLDVFTIASKAFDLYSYIFIYILIKYITGATRKCSQTQNCVCNQSNKM